MGKMTILLFCIFLFLFSFDCYANNEVFSGLVLGVEGGTSINLIDVKSIYNYTNLFAGGTDASDVDAKIKSNNNGDINYVFNVNFDYYFPLSERFILGLGTSYFFEGNKEIKSDTYSFSNPNNRADYPKNYIVKTKIDPKNHFSVGIKPGYKLTDKLLGYLSCSYHFLKSHIFVQTQMDRDNISTQAVITDNGETKTFHGVGVGGGLRYLISKHWSLTLASEWIWFAKQTITGPSIYSTLDEITLTQNEKIYPSWVDIKIGISYNF